MDTIPSTVHGGLKFEYQGDVHTLLGDPKSYAFFNVVDFEEFIMKCPRYEIEPLEQPTLGGIYRNNLRSQK